MSKTRQAIIEAADALRAGTPKSPASHRQVSAALALDSALADVELAEVGLTEWRQLAQTNARHAEAARATARVAITHLQAVLNQCRTHDDQQRADTAARDWLLSIGG